VVYRGRGGKAVADLGGIASLVRSVGSADYRSLEVGNHVVASGVRKMLS